MYQQIYSSPEFSALRRRRRRFVVPISTAFIAWYVGYIVVSAYVPGFVTHRLAGNITVALVMGVLQVLSTFVITAWYVRYANTKIDPEAARIRALVDEMRWEHADGEPMVPAEAQGAPPGGMR